MVLKIFYSDVDVHSYRTLKKINSVNWTVLEYQHIQKKMKFLNGNIPFYLHQKWRNIVYELKDKKTKKGM